MLHVAILTLALVSGDCPTCERNGYGVPHAPGGSYPPGTPTAAALVPPRPLLRYSSLAYMIPCPIVGCVGQNCYSATRPYLPGVPVFNYRQDFNYPWSQAPSVPRPVVGLVPPAGLIEDPLDAPLDAPTDGPEVIPAPLESRRNARSKGQITERAGGGVLVSDTVRPAVKKRTSTANRSSDRAAVRN